MLIWYKKKTDENKQNCQGRLATGKGTFFVVFQGRIDTDKYNTSLNILTPCLDLFGTWCFSSPQLVNLGTLTWAILVYQFIKWGWMIICGNGYPSTLHANLQLRGPFRSRIYSRCVKCRNAWDFKFRYRIDGPSPGRTRTILKKEAGVGVGQLIVSHEDFKWQKAYKNHCPMKRFFEAGW